MKLLKGIVIRRKEKIRKEFIYGTLRLEAPQTYEKQSDAERIQTEACIGEVVHRAEGIEVELGDVVVMVYGSSEVEMPDGTEWYNETNILAIVRDGKLLSYGPRILGFPLDNEQAIDVGLMPKPVISMTDIWLASRYKTKTNQQVFKPHNYSETKGMYKGLGPDEPSLTEGGLMFCRDKLVGQQVIDWELYGIDGLPRTIYFVDKEDVVTDTDEIELPVDASGIRQKHTTNYINLELKSNMPNLPSA